jgi:membrane-bound serine protease (ClpP class)
MKKILLPLLLTLFAFWQISVAPLTIEIWELWAFIGSLGLVAVELFVIPGFGLVGLSGLLGLFMSIFLLQIPNQGFDFTMITLAQWVQGFFMSLGGFGLVAGSGFYALPKLLQNNPNMSLQNTMDKTDGYTSNSYSVEMIGKKGIAKTVLRPSGKILVDDILFDASTQGEYMDAGTPIMIVEQKGTSFKVVSIDLS